jgi:hypothetical protein
VLGQLVLQLGIAPAQQVELALGVRALLAVLGARPARAPTSRARCHSTMWLEYRPSRRKKAPLPPSSVMRSYCSKIESL